MVYLLLYIVFASLASSLHMYRPLRLVMDILSYSEYSSTRSRDRRDAFSRPAGLGERLQRFCVEGFFKITSSKGLCVP